MEIDKNILKEFSISLRMGKIEAGPPLSTILGNIGVNTVKFCKELNDYTKDLPFFFLLEVIVYVYADKTYSFIISEPTVALLLRLVSFKKEIEVNISGGLKIKFVDVVKLEDLYLISFFKFNDCSEITLRFVYGTMTSLNLYVIE